MLYPRPPIGKEIIQPSTPGKTATFPEGYQFDLLNDEILYTRLSVRNDGISVKDGGEYRIIMLDIRAGIAYNRMSVIDNQRGVTVAHVARLWAHTV
jgi:hypothetical protein